MATLIISVHCASDFDHSKFFYHVKVRTAPFAGSHSYQIDLLKSKQRFKKFSMLKISYFFSTNTTMHLALGLCSVLCLGNHGYASVMRMTGVAQS
jgi:hypothetical protein